MSPAYSTETELWYERKQIFFTRKQLIWLIEHLTELREGQWPAHPGASSYIDPLIQKQPGYRAPFEDPCLIAAEVEIRLLRCKRDGAITLMSIRDGESDENLTLFFSMDIESIRRAVSSCLNYCCGWKRKQMDYQSWKKQVDYRRSSQ